MFETQIGPAAILAHQIFTKLRVMVNKGKPPEDQRFGAYACVLTQIDGEKPVLQTLTMIGAPDKTKLDKYMRLAQEKGRRVLSNTDHVSSWQSRDLACDEFGGAIAFHVRPHMRVALSMSGMPEHGDEAFVTVLAVRNHRITEEQALEIARISSNPYIKPLLAEIPV